MIGRKKRHRIVPDQCDQAPLLIVKSCVSAVGHDPANLKGQQAAGPYSSRYELNLFAEVTMSHWRRLHEPEHSYLADWLIVGIITLALVLVVLNGAR